MATVKRRSMEIIEYILVSDPVKPFPTTLMEEGK
jgi:hypothetical protein